MRSLGKATAAIPLRDGPVLRRGFAQTLRVGSIGTVHARRPCPSARILKGTKPSDLLVQCPDKYAHPKSQDRESPRHHSSLVIQIGSPACGGQRGQFPTVSCIDVATGVRRLQDVENDAHEDAADGMNGVMPIKPFVHQPVECSGHRRRFSERNLVFDHHMGHRMQLEVFQFQLGAAVIVHDGVDSFGFIEFEPSRRMRLIIRFVLHGKFLVHADRESIV